MSSAWPLCLGERLRVRLQGNKRARACFFRCKTAKPVYLPIAMNMGDISMQAARLHSKPHLRAIPAGHELVVDDRQFLILGAELQNSSFSCPQFMQSVWPKLQHFNVNTVLANVSWEAIEPQEGVFDFYALDRCISDARKNGLRLILLWFGAFKNGKY